MGGQQRRCEECRPSDTAGFPVRSPRVPDHHCDHRAGHEDLAVGTGLHRHGPGDAADHRDGLYLTELGASGAGSAKVVVQQQTKQSPVKNGQVVEGGSFFGVGADFGLQGLTFREPRTLRFRLGIPSSGEP